MKRSGERTWNSDEACDMLLTLNSGFAVHKHNVWLSLMLFQRLAVKEKLSVTQPYIVNLVHI